MRQLSYDQFTCHTEIDNQPLLRTNSQSISIADIHTADTNRKLQQIAFESIEYLLQEEAEEKEYIILQNSIRQQLAMQLNIENLAKFDFSNLENKIQLIFQWIIVVFYRTSSEMFEWKSFKEICIIEDKGVDLRNRIGLKNIVRMTKLEFELTKQLMLYRLSIESKNNNNKDVVQFISQIFDIIQIIIRTFEAGQKVMRIEEELIRRQIQENQSKEEEK
ncbi:unnamed protein product (macronuclear) [Paramecium tetraurelia]|uniref:Uncharacterized protein n=1 Tax=Paramecium tetraurelia TaxID=5888 RepID=A0CKG9_PARTE|nr:uncharacterized protein GSPATT00001000001 [Paramecium tetraurelia]CAK71286.1 unnamed protein product [Paramecium tetraurelia]|eukprot:XP_001438683.1 hypothetical protein (macronuclear) [Paramecium tetraurelia strain d4-2]